MCDSYKYAIEEKWITIDKVGISQSFFSSLKENKYPIIEEKGLSFKFTYVGVLVYENEILLVLPKYYNENFQSKLICTRQLMNLFRKIPSSIVNNHKDALIISKDIDDEQISEIALADFIIKDYIKNGYYITSKLEVNRNSSGRIAWNKTISRIMPIISNGYPVYNDYYSTKSRVDYNNLVHIIHKEVVNVCICKYGYLLGYNVKGRSMQNSINVLNRIGDIRKISLIIRSELEKVYNDREITLLKCIYNYFNPTREKSNKGLNIYGTTSFNLIWEHICGYIFDNEYDNYKGTIPIPKWKAINGNYVQNNKNALNPDIIRKYNNIIMIIDAKYYSIKLTTDVVEGNPGTYDIIKQYSYEKAIKKKYKNYNTINMLVYPKVMKNEIVLFGSVSLDIFDLKPIKNIYLNPIYAIDLYLKSHRLDPKEIETIINL